MIILALDLAANTGHAYGAAGQRPYSGVWNLRQAGGDYYLWSGALFDNLQRIVSEFGVPDVLVVEQAMSASSRVGDHHAVQSQFMLQGCALAFARHVGIRHVRESAPTIRKHLCGKAFAAVTPPPNISKDKLRAMTKLETKKMVRDRVAVLGLIDPSCEQYDRTDAIAVFAWASDLLARTPAPFELFA